MQKEFLGIPVPAVAASCDVHLRTDARGHVAFCGVYDRQAGRWYTCCRDVTTVGNADPDTLAAWQLANVLTAVDAIEAMRRTVRS